MGVPEGCDGSPGLPGVGVATAPARVSARGLAPAWAHFALAAGAGVMTVSLVAASARNRVLVIGAMATGVACLAAIIELDRGRILPAAVLRNFVALLSGALVGAIAGMMVGFPLALVSRTPMGSSDVFEILAILAADVSGLLAFALVVCLWRAAPGATLRACFYAALRFVLILPAGGLVLGAVFTATRLHDVAAAQLVAALVASALVAATRAAGAIRPTQAARRRFGGWPRLDAGDE